eukprot:4792449-Prymnesium_polylepis.3
MQQERVPVKHTHNPFVVRYFSNGDSYSKITYSKITEKQPTNSTRHTTCNTKGKHLCPFRLPPPPPGHRPPPAHRGADLPRRNETTQRAAAPRGERGGRCRFRPERVRAGRRGRYRWAGVGRPPRTTTHQATGPPARVILAPHAPHRTTRECSTPSVRRRQGTNRTARAHAESCL